MRKFLANPFGFAPSGSIPNKLTTLDVTQVGLFAAAVYGAIQALAPVLPGGTDVANLVGAVVSATTAVVALWHRFRGDNKTPAAS